MTDGDVDRFVTLSDSLGVAPPPAAVAELRALVERAAGGGSALLHGDPCIGNVLWTDEGVRLVDFEQAALGPGLSELAYLHVGFPTCGWVDVVEPTELRSAEQAYRRAWFELTGSDAPGDLVDECVAWVMRSDALVQRTERGRRDEFARLVVEDWSWGPQTARQRLAHRVGRIAELARGSRWLHETADHAARLHRAMLAAWPGCSPLPTDGLDLSIP